MPPKAKKPSSESAMKEGNHQPAMSAICPFLSTDQEKLLREELARFSEFEIEKFLLICAATGLNPYLRQIYATGRREDDGNGNYVTRLVPIVSIEGLRSLAAATDEYEGQTQPMWCNKDGKWSDVWLAESPAPYAAKVGVRRKGFPDPLFSVGRYDSFVQTKKGRGENKPSPTSFWLKAPDNQLLKCVEANALRKAFPQKLGGLYLAEEIRHDDDEPAAPAPESAPLATVEEVAPPVKPKREAKPKAEKPVGPKEKAPEPEGKTPEEEKNRAEAETGDPMFDELPPAEKPAKAETPKGNTFLNHVIKCVSHKEFSEKKIGDLTLEQLERLKKHWVDKHIDKWKDTPEDNLKKAEAKAICEALAFRKSQQS